jgi:hypothetical protein
MNLDVRQSRDEFAESTVRGVLSDLNGLAELGMSSGEIDSTILLLDDLSAELAEAAEALRKLKKGDAS